MYQVGKLCNDVDGPRFVVVVVDLVGIVRIDVAGQRIFQDLVVRIGPRGDVVGASGQVVGKRDVRDDVKAGIDRQATFMLQRGQQNDRRAAVPDEVGYGLESARPSRSRRRRWWRHCQDS